MNWRQLRYFIAIADEGSFSRAARQLGVAQPALSQHVLAMEAELGTILLQRSSKGIQLTEAGLRLLSEAREIGHRFDNLRDHVLGRDAPPSGEVRFGMPSTVSEQIGAPLIEAAQRAYPGIRLRISEAMSGYIYTWLCDGIIDVALLFDMPQMQGLTRHPLLVEDIVLFAGADTKDAPRNSSLPLQTALRLPLILPGPGHGLRTLIDAAALSIGAACTPRTEIDSYRQIKQLVARGPSYGMLPMGAIAAETHDGILQAWRIVRPSVRRHVFLAHRTDRPLSNASNLIAQCTLAIVRSKVEAGEWQARWVGPKTNTLSL